MHLVLLLDPLSEGAQKWIAILEKHEELFPEVYFELYLNPAQHSETPLKRFYRYSVEPRVQYDNKGNEIPAQVTFNGLSVDPIYTLGMDVPPSWLVRPREALYDLDNVQPSILPPDGLHALFSLDYLVVEGHARETKSNSPPRGVQLQLTTSSPAANHTPSVVDDTQVVANLGYLQFKARPGTFNLTIREGGGREVYNIDSVGSEGWNSPSVEDSGEELTVMSFEGLTLYPRLSRKPGMERVDVLAGLQQRSSHSQTVIHNILSKVSSLFTSKSESTTEVAETGARQADINIFTVASGLLYERFASIMILSVLRNTNSTVKFWFIENFLSPSFLEFIPHMAEEYGFQYELVTYKWPSWLRAQKEKQRIIWAYKILFLDVLFPMDLDKVIFVDADQIVRADLQELVDLDLHGAPYGYTPMGDDNYEMEGFRFWKTGYWKDFLGDLPYHISALYVVDLVRFRQMAAGDILRGQYQMLSADPNSLANLDQDLPNNIQRDVPIFSLHEDWLWCETWCGADRLHRAKTIDLCQNPLTKEPKLSRARRIPEWEEYDNEIAQFAGRLAAEGKIQSSIATARSDVLANVGLVQPAHDDDVEGKDLKRQHPHDEL
jgi:UDP-glucose:glycoprotein glucosyltransferase